MPRKLYLETFGCQMNVLDSELVLGQLRAHGYESVEDRDAADIIIYNTCSVREHAENKVWSRLGELRDRKKCEPGLVIGVIGCMAERDGVNIFKRHPQVDILCGPGELDKLAGMVHNAVVTGERNAQHKTQNAEQRTTDNGQRTGNQDLIRKLPRQVALMGANVRRSSTLVAAEDHLELLDLSRSISASDEVSQAYVRITRGCNKFCTYCVVPYTRGPEVHRPPQNIIEEVRKLTDAGAREVTLLGQTINHYAFEHGDGRTTTFADLLYQIHEGVPELPRLRFVTSFPRDFSDEALAILGKKKNLRLMIARGGIGADALQEIRSVVGGVLVQDRDRTLGNVSEFKVVTKRQPTPEEWAGMLFGWKVGKHVKSNSIVYCRGEQTLGVGAGQMARVDSSRIAVWKAGEAKLDLRGSVVASEALFPFADGLIAAADAGATAAIQPGGSVRDAEVIAAADDRGMTMVFTGIRHFKH